MREKLTNWLLNRLHGKEYSHSPEYLLGRLAAKEITAINRLFAQLRVNAEIDPHNVVASDTGGFIRYHVVSRGKINSIASIEKDLSVLISGIRSDDVTVNIRLPSLTIELPYPLQGKVLEWSDAKLGALRPFQMLAGMDYTKRTPAPAILDFGAKHVAHFLLAGTTGSGKTTMLASMLTSFCLATPSDKAQIIFLDPKYDEDWTALAGLPHVTLYSDPQDCVKAIRAVHAELDRRRKAPDSRKVLLIIDEFADLVTGLDADTAFEIQTLVSRLTNVGRSKNIHVGICTQKPTVDIIATTSKGNLSTRLCGLVTTAEESKVGMGRADVGCELLPGRGAFYAVVAGGNVQRIQGYWLDPEALTAAVDAIVAKEGMTVPFCIDLDPPTLSEDMTPALTETEELAAKILGVYSYDQLFEESGKTRHGMQTKAIQVNFPNATNEGEPRRKTVAAFKLIKQQRATTPDF